MRSMLHEREILTVRERNSQASHDETETQLATVNNLLGSPAAVLPVWLWGVVAAAGAVLAVTAALTESFVSAVAYPLTAALAVVALLLFRRRQLASEHARTSQLQSETQRLSEREQAIDKEATKLHAQIERIASRLDKTASAAGLEVPNELSETERLAASLSVRLKQLVGWLAAQEDVQSARKSEKAASTAHQRAREEHEAAQEQLDHSNQSWQQYLAERGFTTITPPDQFGLVLDAAEKARHALSSHLESESRLRQIEQYVARIRPQLRETRRRCGRGCGPGAPGLPELDELSADLARTLREEKERRELVTLREELETELGRLERHLAKKQQTRDQLMRTVSAEDDDAFLQMADAHRHWRDSKLAADEQELTLRTIAGSQSAWPDLERELQETTPVDLAEERRRLERELERLDVEIAKNKQAVGRIDERMQQMAQDERLGEKRLEEEILKQSLTDAVRQWAVRAVCRELLDRAQRTYECQRQPLVIRRASGYLQTMTGQRYRMMLPVGEDRVQLDSASLGRKPEETWSSGLADQAYLAIRLGLAREFACRGEPLPMILDDVLVRFDHARQRAAVEVLLNFAAEQQVLLFSCRRDLADLVREVHQSGETNHVPIGFFDVEDGSVRREVK
jgi:hypothetical protein